MEKIRHAARRALRLDGGEKGRFYRVELGTARPRHTSCLWAPVQRFPSFVILVLTVLFGAPATYAGTEIPFAFQGNMVWLKLESQGTTLNFLLDSGAGRSVLDTAAAKRLGLKEGARQLVQGAEGCCSAYHVENFHGAVCGVAAPSSLLALDLSAVSKSCGSHIDGLLGLDFFRGRIVQIDYRERKVRLFGRSEAVPANGQALPLVRRNDTFCLRVSVDGNSAEWMRLDTGCSASLEWVTKLAGARADRRISIAAAVSSARNIQTTVSLGAEKFFAIKTGLHEQPMFPGESGLVGNGLLSNFRVTIDADKSRAWFERIVPTR